MAKKKRRKVPRQRKRLSYDEYNPGFFEKMRDFHPIEELEEYFRNQDKEMVKIAK